MVTASHRIGLDREIAMSTWQRAAQKTLPIVRKECASPATTHVHPIVVGIPLLSATWFLVVAWAAFRGGTSSLVLVAVTFITAIFFALLVGGAAMARDLAPEAGAHRSLNAFLAGEVEIATSHVSGWEVLAQTAVMPLAIAIGATAIAFIAVAV